MHNRAYALITGAFVLALLVAIGGMAYWLSDTDPQRRPYLLLTEQSVAGLNDDSRIYYRGVAAGRVESIELDPEQPGQVRILIQVDREVPITRGTYAKLESQGLTGVSRLHLEDSGEDPETLETSAADPATIPLRPSLLARLSDSGEDALEQLVRVAGRLEKLLSEENIQRFDRVMANLEEFSGGLTALEDQAGEALESIPPLSEDARRTLQTVERSAAEFEGVGERIHTLADELEALSRTADRVGSEVEVETLPQLNETLRRLDEASRDLSRFSRQLEREPDSLLRGRRVLEPGPGEAGYQREDEE